MDPELQNALAELQKAWAAFKASHTDEQMQARIRGVVDPLTEQMTERVSEAVTMAEDKVNALIAEQERLRAASGGQAGEGVSPEARAYNEAFGVFMRRGEQAPIDAAAAAVTDPKMAARVGQDDQGGYFVSTEMDAEIDRVVRTTSAMRRLASLRTVGVTALDKLINKSGSTAGFVGEEDARTETAAPSWSKLTFPLHEVYAMPAVTQQMLDDADRDMEAELAEDASAEMAEIEGTAFITGNGVTRPRGLLTYPTVADASWAWGKLGYVATGAAADFGKDPGDNLIDVLYALKSEFVANAAWVMSRATMGRVRKFKDGEGNYLWAPGFGQQPSTLLGYPVETDDNMPAVSAGEFPIAFGDFGRGYQIGERPGVVLLRDPYSSKPYVLLYFRKRIGGGVKNYQSIKLLKIAAS